MLYTKSDKIQQYTLGRKGGSNTGNLTETLMEELNCKTVLKLPVLGGISESVVVTWIIMAVLVLLSIILVRNLKVENPGKVQLALESMIGWAQDFFEGIIGKEKNTDKLLDAIEKSKENDAYKLLTGLGIPNVGKAAAKAIMKYFKDMDHLKEASVEQLTEVNDIGEVSALCIRNFFTDEKNIEILDRLKEYGVNMRAEETETVESVLTGKTVVVTGTLPTLGRKEASELIEKYGGKASGSVSKKTDYVLAGENAGSKLTKAQELGIPVISEEQLKEMLGI